MNALRIITIIFGVLLITMGVLRVVFHMETVYFSLNGMQMALFNGGSALYTLLENFLGGFCFIYHGLMTYNFKKYKLPDMSSELIDENTEPVFPPGLSGAVLFCGYYMILHLLCNAFFVIAFFAYFPYHSATMPMFFVAAIYMVSFIIVPMWVVFRNIGINQSIDQAKATIKTLQLAAKLKRRK